MLKSLMKVAAAAALFTAGPALAQIQTIDPDQAGGYETNPETVPETYPEYTNPEYIPQDSGTGSEWAPVDTQPVEGAPVDTYGQPAPEATAPAAATPATQDSTVPREDVFSAAEGLFGRGAAGLGGILENILRDQGEPTAYISGQEAGGAFIFGVRYGSGTMHHQVEGDRAVYWTGPSLGFDVGADANKVFVLVYNLHDSQDLFKRYPGAEGPCLFRRRLQRPVYAARRRRADPDQARRRHAARRQCRLHALFRAQPLGAVLGSRPAARAASRRPGTARPGFRRPAAFREP